MELSAVPQTVMAGAPVRFTISDQRNRRSRLDDNGDARGSESRNWGLFHGRRRLKTGGAGRSEHFSHRFDQPDIYDLKVCDLSSGRVLGKVRVKVVGTFFEELDALFVERSWDKLNLWWAAIRDRISEPAFAWELVDLEDLITHRFAHNGRLHADAYPHLLALYHPELGSQADRREEKLRANGIPYGVDDLFQIAQTKVTRTKSGYKPTAHKFPQWFGRVLHRTFLDLLGRNPMRAERNNESPKHDESQAGLFESQPSREADPAIAADDPIRHGVEPSEQEDSTARLSYEDRSSWDGMSLADRFVMKVQKRLDPLKSEWAAVLKKNREYGQRHSPAGQWIGKYEIRRKLNELGWPQHKPSIDELREVLPWLEKATFSNKKRRKRVTGFAQQLKHVLDVLGQTQSGNSPLTQRIAFRVGQFEDMLTGNARRRLTVPRMACLLKDLEQFTSHLTRRDIGTPTEVELLQGVTSSFLDELPGVLKLAHAWRIGMRLSRDYRIPPHSDVLKDLRHWLRTRTTLSNNGKRNKRDALFAEGFIIDFETLRPRVGKCGDSIPFRILGLWLNAVSKSGPPQAELVALDRAFWIVDEVSTQAVAVLQDLVDALESGNLHRLRAEASQIAARLKKYEPQCHGRDELLACLRVLSQADNADVVFDCCRRTSSRLRSCVIGAKLQSHLDELAASMSNPDVFASNENDDRHAFLRLWKQCLEWIDECVESDERAGLKLLAMEFENLCALRKITDEMADELSATDELWHVTHNGLPGQCERMRQLSNWLVRSLFQLSRPEVQDENDSMQVWKTTVTQIKRDLLWEFQVLEPQLSHGDLGDLKRCIKLVQDKVRPKRRRPPAKG